MPTLDTRPDGALVIEADTAAEALSQVEARLGSDAEIVSAEKVHRGGWKGFFAREQVQLVARGRATGSPRTSVPATDDEPGVGSGLAAALAAMTREAEREDAHFEAILARQFGDAPAPVATSATGPAAPPAQAAPTGPVVPVVPVVPVEAVVQDDPVVPVEGVVLDDPVVPVEAVVQDEPVVPAAPSAAPAPWGPSGPPAPSVASAPRSAHGVASGVRWDVDRLHDLRVPAAIVAACEHLDPADDVAWVMAIAGAVSSWCRPLPQGRSILVGPRAHRLGRSLQVPLVGSGSPSGRAGSVALRLTDSVNGRAQLAQARAGRWGHLVAGGSRWQGLLLEDVAAVSWVGDEALPDALEAANRLGLVLGYGLGHATGSSAVRATPIDVAFVLRSLLPRDIG